MNAANALVFAAFGSLMEILPRAFPSWFPHTGADQASCRALWLLVMGAVQITMGVGFLVRARLLPATFRLFSSVPTAGTGSLALPEARGASSR